MVESVILVVVLRAVETLERSYLGNNWSGKHFGGIQLLDIGSPRFASARR